MITKKGKEISVRLIYSKFFRNQKYRSTKQHLFQKRKFQDHLQMLTKDNNSSPSLNNLIQRGKFNLVEEEWDKKEIISPINFIIETQIQITIYFNFYL